MSAPKRYRAVANGNVLPAEAVPQGLIDAGIYVPVDEEAEAAAAKKAATPAAEPDPSPSLVQPEAEIMTTAHLSQPAKQARPRKAARKRRG